ncbi:MAG: YfiR/HmsC family protein [Bacteroidales bacterium]
MRCFRKTLLVWMLAQVLTGGMAKVMAQVLAGEGFNDQTRALYILDISKYVEFDSTYERNVTNERDSVFVISILSEDLDLYWELEKLSRTRKTVQGKTIRILVSKDIDGLSPSQVVFVSQRDNYRITDVLKKIMGQNTLLISEGYPFRTSMINFVVVEGHPRFEVNEELMAAEGLFANELFLSQAVKTREDWEALYEFTDEELQKEKTITREQRVLIEQQVRTIQEQQNQIEQQRMLIRSNRELLLEMQGEIHAREQQIAEQSVVLQRQGGEIANQKKTIESQLEEVSAQREILARQEENIQKKERTISENELTIREQDRTLVLQAEAMQKQRIIIIASIIAMLLLFGLLYFIWRNYRNKKRANILLKAQRDQIAYQKKHITDSINYARKIQAAILPSMELFTDKLDHFVLFRPRDIVSGDFYWVEEVDRQIIIIAADCTGHGVPGAFMSMLGVSLLNEIVLTEKIVRPDLILNTLRTKVIEALKQKGESRIMDGMEMAVCSLQQESGHLLFSGAVNPLYLISQGELRQAKADKMPVAIHEVMDPFSLHEIELKRGDTFYVFSDGFADQFGGAMQKKYMAKNLRKFLLSVQDHSMIEQGALLGAEFDQYRNGLEQVDDVLVIGVRCS